MSNIYINIYVRLISAQAPVVSHTRHMHAKQTQHNLRAKTKASADKHADCTKTEACPGWVLSPLLVCSLSLPFFLLVGCIRGARARACRSVVARAPSGERRFW